MEVTIRYSKTQFEAAAKFISENNQTYLGRLKYIRDHIRKSMWEIAEKFPHLQSLSTMGYTVIGSVEEAEGIDGDVNIVHIEIMVDPSLAEEPSYTETVYSFNKE